MSELNPPEGPYVLTGPATDVEANKLRTSSAAFRRMLAASLQYIPGCSQIADLKVTATGTDVNVSIAQGDAFVLGTLASDQGMYHGRESGTKVIPLLTNNPAHATLDRIDLCVARFNDTFYTGALDTFSIEMVTGTPAGSPVAPALPANSIALAQILIVHATTVVNPANITDTRTFAGAAKRRIGQIITTAGQVNPSFQNIPPGFTVIEVQGSFKDNSGGAGVTQLLIRINNDSTANYSSEQMRASGTATAVSENLLGTSGWGGVIAQGAVAAGRVATVVLRLPNYSRTDFKNWHSQSHLSIDNATGNQQQYLHSGYFQGSTAPINRLDFIHTFLVGQMINLFAEN